MLINQPGKDQAGTEGLTIKGHVLYEANVDGLLLCKSHKIHQLIFIEASHNYTVHLGVRREDNNWWKPNFASLPYKQDLAVTQGQNLVN